MEGGLLAVAISVICVDFVTRVWTAVVGRLIRLGSKNYPLAVAESCGERRGARPFLCLKALSRRGGDGVSDFGVNRPPVLEIILSLSVAAEIFWQRWQSMADAITGSPLGMGEPAWSGVSIICGGALETERGFYEGVSSFVVGFRADYGPQGVRSLYQRVSIGGPFWVSLWGPFFQKIGAPAERFIDLERAVFAIVLWRGSAARKGLSRPA